MNTINFFYKSPITWCLILMLIQIFTAVVLEPTPERTASDLAVYEEMLLAAGDNQQLTDLIETQKSKSAYKSEVIVALTSSQKTISGLITLLLLLYLYVSYRRMKREEKANSALTTD